MKPSGFFQWVLRLGAIRGTAVMTLICIGASLVLAIGITTALHRLSVMGIVISLAIPTLIVPTTWYPFFLVSERLRTTEARLRTSEEKYRSILESISEAYAEFDRHGRLVFWNEALGRITGYGPEDLAQRRIEDFTPPEGLRPVLDAAGKPRDALGRSAALCNFTITARNGTARTLEASFSVLPGESEERRGWRAVIRDVTERVDREREKQEYEDQLRRARRMEALGTLAGGVAHDLNNILSGIVGYPDLLLLDCPQDSPLRQSLVAIKESGMRAADVVQDLLTLSRRGMVASEVLNLNRVVSAYLASPEHGLLRQNHPGVEVAVALDPNLLNVVGSSVHISKSVMNLVINAFEAIPANGTVTVATENVYLDQPLRGYDRVKTGDYVTLRVGDSGTGIAPEDLDRIFEPFYTKKVMGRSGTGLGLAVVWGTVKDHQGYIDIRSEPGRGTVVTLYFPASRREPPAAAAAPAIERYLGRGEQVLVVDDMSDQRELAAKVLQRLGYVPRTASSGEEALELLKGGPVDLVLLDMIMEPGMDGLDTTRKLRDLQPGVRVILASGFAETSRVREALSLGNIAYVKKPYRLESLARAAHEALHTA